MALKFVVEQFNSTPRLIIIQYMSEDMIKQLKVGFLKTKLNEELSAE